MSSVLKNTAYVLPSFRGRRKRICSGTVKIGYSMQSNSSGQLKLATLDGFQYRSLSYHSDSQTWTDVIYWGCSEENHMDSAMKACEQFKAHPDCQAFMALIAPKTIYIEHQERHRLLLVLRFKNNWLHLFCY